jgi:hypothetical protein
LFVEVVQVVFDAADQRPQSGGLLLGGHGFGAGPGVEFGDGSDAFAVAEQGVEVVAQFGQVGRV